MSCFKTIGIKLGLSMKVCENRYLSSVKGHLVLKDIKTGKRQTMLSNAIFMFLRVSDPLESSWDEQILLKILYLLISRFLTPLQ